MMPRYVFSGVNEIVRVDKNVTDKDLIGVGTHGLLTCVAVIIRGNDKMSLIHHTPNTDSTSMMHEIAWVGEPFEITLVKNKAEMDATIANNAEFVNAKKAKNLDPDTETNIINFFRTQKMAHNIKKRFITKSGMVFANIDGTISTEPEDDKLTLTSPEASLRAAVNMINGIYAPTVMQPTLEYDGTQFTPSIELNNQTHTIACLLSKQLAAIQKGINAENVLNALKEVDTWLKKQGSKNGVQMNLYQLKDPNDMNQAKSLKIILQEWVSFLKAKEKVLKDEIPDNVFRPRVR